MEYLNPKDSLIILANRLDWNFFEESFSSLFSPRKGQPPKPIRLVVGLLMIQHMEGISDVKLIDSWKHNPYWQYFCGYGHLQWYCPIDPSCLSRWRKRLGPSGLEKILGATIHEAVSSRLISTQDLSKVIVDTTCDGKEHILSYRRQASQYDASKAGSLGSFPRVSFTTDVCPRGG